MSTSFEIQGVDTVPEKDRSGKPSSLISIFVGSNLSLSVMVFGWLSILYGLGWWASVSAIFVGTLIGSIFVSFSSLLGWRASTNNSVASGAFFGVKGRLIASFVGLLLCIQYVALTVWTGGETISAGWARISKNESSDLTVAIGFAIIALCIVFFALLGYRWIVRLNNFVAPAMLILIVLTIIALWGSFDPTYAGDPELYALGTFWPTWLLATLTCGLAGPLSYATQTGDWARYISETSHSAGEIVKKTFIALVVGLTIPTLFGAFVAVAAFDENSFAAGYVANSPTWLLVPLLLIAVIGSLGQGSINLYSMGLDLDAILPRLSRLKSTILMAAVSTGLVFLGRFIYDAEAAVTNSVLFLTCLATSWLAITLYAFRLNRGDIDKEAVQIFNRRTKGGIYWFSNGWNFRAILAWVIGSTLGILGVSTVDYVGPISNLINGLDVSIPAAAIGGIISFKALNTLKR